MIKKYSPDLIFICTVIFLIGFGTLVMYSAGAFTAAMKFENYAHYLMKHIQWITIGTILYFLCSRFKYKNIKYMIPWIVSLTWIIILLAFLLNPTNRPSRWLIIDGRSWLTTSDVARLMLIMYTAYFLDKYQKYISDWKFMLIKFTPTISFTLFLILMQPDLSSTFIIGTIIFVMLIIGKVSPKYLTILLLMSIVAFSIKIISSEYQRERLMNWIQPSETIGDIQQHASKLALGRGELIGKGIGSSRLKNGHLPAAHTDFVFAILGEEYGFLGTVVLFISFGIIFHFGIQILKIAPDRFGLFLALGIILNLIFYFLINVAYVVGLAPNTGLTMPFLSYGGSNTIFTLGAVGILISIVRDASNGMKTYHKRLINV